MLIHRWPLAPAGPPGAWFPTPTVGELIPPSLQQAGNLARRDQRAEAGAGVWDLCCGRAEVESSYFITLLSWEGKDSWVWNQGSALTSPLDGCAHSGRKPAAHCLAGVGVTPDPGGALQGFWQLQLPGDLGYKHFLELWCGRFSGIDPLFAQNEAHS